jgi:hypothetical protein
MTGASSGSRTRSARTSSRSSMTVTATNPRSSQVSFGSIAGTNNLGDPTLADAILDRAYHRAHPPYAYGALAPQSDWDWIIGTEGEGVIARPRARRDVTARATSGSSPGEPPVRSCWSRGRL